MAGTPESKVKDKIDKILKSCAPHCWWHKPVQYGMGRRCLDYHCCMHGIYFAVEAKAPGEMPSKFQELTIKEIKAAGGRVFVIDGKDHSIENLALWLATTHERYMERQHEKTRRANAARVPE